MLLPLNRVKELIYACSGIRDGNMSLIVGERGIVLDNRRKFSDQIGLDGNSLVYAQLEHGTEIKSVGESDRGKTLRADGLITNRPGVNLFMALGDCVGVAIYDPEHSCLGLFHVSRHNLKLGIARSAVQSLVNNFNSLPENLLVEFSPSIGPCCYKPFVLKAADKEMEKYIVSNGGEPALDVWDWAEDKLKEAGVSAENIHNPKICTCHGGEYFSYKKFLNEKLADDNRFAVILGMKN